MTDLEIKLIENQNKSIEFLIEAIDELSKLSQLHQKLIEELLSVKSLVPSEVKI